MIGGSLVTLVVAFGFCPKILGGGGDLRMMVLLFNECSLSGRDTQPQLAVLKKIELFALPDMGMQKLCDNEPPGETSLTDIWFSGLLQFSEYSTCL